MVTKSKNGTGPVLVDHVGWDEAGHRVRATPAATGDEIDARRIATRLEAAPNIRRLICKIGDREAIIRALVHVAPERQSAIRAALQREGDAQKRKKPIGELYRPRKRAESQPESPAHREWLEAVTTGQVNMLEGLYPGKGGERRIAEHLESVHGAIVDRRYAGISSPTGRRVPDDFVHHVEAFARKMLSTRPGEGWVESKGGISRVRRRRGRPKRSASHSPSSEGHAWLALFHERLLGVARYAAQLASGLDSERLNKLDGPRRARVAADTADLIATLRANPDAMAALLQMKREAHERKRRRK